MLTFGTDRPEKEEEKKWAMILFNSNFSSIHSLIEHINVVCFSAEIYE